MAERHQGREPATTQGRDVPQEAMGQLVATSLVAAFFQQRITEPLFKAVNRLQRRFVPEVGGEAVVLLRGEVMAMTPHQGKQAAVLGSDRVDVLPARQEMMSHGANDVKAVGYDARLREMLARECAIAGGQVHTDDLDEMFALQSCQIAFQRSFTAA